MTTEEIKTMLDNIVVELSAVEDFAGILDPEFIPFIAIGKVIEKQVPGVAALVSNWIQGVPPTDAELSEKAEELKVLSDEAGI